MNEIAGGIDYGRGITNIDIETGIRYGVISQHSLLPDALDEIYTLGTDYAYKEALKELIEEGMEEYRAYEELECWETSNISYEKEGYILQTTDLGLYILKSPFYTHCLFCSPCCPGAGDLNNPIENGVKTYCLGADWFEEQETGKWIDCEYCDGTGLRRKIDIFNYNEDEFIKNGGIVFDVDRIKCWVCKENEKYGYLGLVKEYENKAPYPIFEVEKEV